MQHSIIVLAQNWPTSSPPFWVHIPIPEHRVFAKKGPRLFWDIWATYVILQVGHFRLIFTSVCYLGIEWTSIQPLSTPVILWALGIGANPFWHWARGVVHQCITGQETNFPLRSLINRNPIWMSSDGRSQAGIPTVNLLTMRCHC